MKEVEKALEKKAKKSKKAEPVVEASTETKS
jgi:hypothetical protein